jgi:hypothetical protein
MSVKGLVGLALIVLGVLGLVYGGFSYTEERHDVELGPVELAVTEKERINVPVWLGVASIAAGAGLLLVSRHKG